MAKPNFGFQKRQKELDKKKKKEEKLLRRQEKAASSSEEGADGEVCTSQPNEPDTELVGDAEPPTNGSNC